MLGKFKVDNYSDFILRHRWWVIALSILTVFGMMSGLSNFGFNQEYRVFFSDDNPHLKAFDEQQKVYTKNDNILFAISPKDVEGGVFNQEVLEAIEVATSEAWKLPYAPRVTSVTRFQHTIATEDELIVEDLVDGAAELSDEEVLAKKHIALGEPSILGQLINKDSSVTAINITFQMPEKNPEIELPRLVGGVRALQEKIQENYPVEVRLSGVVMLSNAFFEASMQDQSTLVPLMYLIIVVIAFVLLRSIAATITTLLLVFFSMLASLGVFFHLGGLMTPPSSSATTVITTLAVADSIHILVTMFSGMRKGMAKNEAIKYALRLNIGPVFLTSLTTAVGFLSMNFSDTPPFHDLGNITAFGVMFAFVLSVTFLPAMMSVVPVRASTSQGSYSNWMNAFADYVLAHRKKVFAGAAIVSVIAVIGIPLNEFDDNFVQYFDETVEFRTDSDYIDKNLTGMYQIAYSLDSGRDYGVSDPKFLQEVDSFVNWFRGQAEVAHVSTYTDTFKRLNKNMHGDDQDYYRLPEDSELAAQYLLMYELSLPEGLDLNNQLDIGKSSTQVNVTLFDMTSSELTEFSERGTAWLEENTSLKAYGVGPAVMFAYISETNMRSMFVSTFIALLVISLLIGISLRSVRLGVLSLIPNILPLAIAFGVWGYFIGEVNVSVSMVMGMALGIIVDDTVHFLSKYLRARREEGMNGEDAVRYAFSSVGVAIVITSIILIAGFSVLAQSSFGMNSGMAKLTTIAIIVALIADFLLLPVLLIKLDKQEYPSVDSENQKKSTAAVDIDENDEESNKKTEGSVYA